MTTVARAPAAPHSSRAAGPRRAGRGGPGGRAWRSASPAPSAAERTARRLRARVGARGLPRHARACSTMPAARPPRASSGRPTATPRRPPPPPASAPGSGGRARRRGAGAGRGAHARLRHRAGASWCCRSSDERVTGARSSPSPACAGRGPHAAQRAARARHAALARRQGAGRGTGRRAHLPLGGDRRDRSPARSRPRRPREERGRLYARGFPRDTPVGQNGLERAFEDRLAGRPGGELLAGERVLARAPAPARAPVRTTIDTRLQEAAVTRSPGASAASPRSIRATARSARSPGSPSRRPSRRAPRSRS